jgi:cullin 1
VLFSETLIVLANFGKKTHDLEVTTMQAIPLNTFNGGKTKTYDELKDELNVDEDVTKPLMHSLSCEKYKVVRKTPATKSINSTDSFTVNIKITSNTRKMRILMPEKTSHNSKKFKEDRNHAIEATIKVRKTLRHQQLQMEVLSQICLFKPNPRVIKKRIEALKKRDCLGRSEGETRFTV